MAAVGQVINVSWNDVAISPWHEAMLPQARWRMNQKTRQKIDPYRLGGAYKILI